MSLTKHEKHIDALGRLNKAQKEAQGDVGCVTRAESLAMKRKRDAMSTDEQQIEERLAATARAPRLTPDAIDAMIAGERYWSPEGTTLTVCVLILRNGFTVTGESASASAANFDAQIGQEIARKNAREKIWMLEGYLLRERLHQQEELMQQQRFIATGPSNVAWFGDAHFLERKSDRMEACMVRCVDGDRQINFGDLFERTEDGGIRFVRNVAEVREATSVSTAEDGRTIFNIDPEA